METQAKIALVGGVSGLIGKTAIGPLDRIHIMAQTKPAEHFNAFKLPTNIYNICKSEGFFSLWKGHSMIIVRTIPFRRRKIE